MRPVTLGASVGAPRLLCMRGARVAITRPVPKGVKPMEFDEIDEIDDMPERYENDLEEFELNQLANDREHEPPVDDETPLGHEIEESGGFLEE